MMLAASSGKLDVFLNWSLAEALITPEICRTAAAAPCSELLQWLVETGECCINIDISLCAAAARAGRVANLRYLTEVAKYPWQSSQSVLLAAFEGASMSGIDTEAVVEYILSQRDFQLTSRRLQSLKKGCVADPRGSDTLHHLQKYEAELRCKQRDAQHNERREGA
jgi:hypothetical protein